MMKPKKAKVIHKHYQGDDGYWPGYAFSDWSPEKCTLTVVMEGGKIKDMNVSRSFYDSVEIGDEIEKGLGYVKKCKKNE